jgi:hypothetical protein
VTAERRGWWFWFPPLLILCLAWTLASPLFAPPDEYAHVVEAVAVGRGQFVGKNRITLLGSITEVRVPGTYNNLAKDTPCFTTRPERTPDCVPDVKVDRALRPALTIAGRYPPLFYLPLAPATRVFSPPAAIYVMRVIVCLLCATFLTLAFTSAESLGRWAVFGVAAAATPMALHLASVVNPNGLEIASAMALWTSTLALARGPTFNAHLIPRAGVAYAVFANARGLSLPMAMIALVLPLALASRDRRHEIVQSRFARAWLALIAIATATAVIWGVVRGRVPAVAADTHFTLAEGLGRSWRLFEEGVAWFGLLDVRVRAAIAIWSVLWGVMIVVGIRCGRGRDRLVLGALVVLSLAFPIAVSLLHPPPIYTIFLGRYSLPLWMGVPIIGGILAATSPRNARSPKRATRAVFAGAFGLGQVVAFATAAHRYAVGSGGRVLYFLDPRWEGPVPPLLLLILTIAGAVALAWRVASYRVEGELALPPRQDASRASPA